MSSHSRETSSAKEPLTPEQYAHMVQAVLSSLSEAEHHNWRILRRLPTRGAEWYGASLHKTLEYVLKNALTIAHEIEGLVEP